MGLNDEGLSVLNGVSQLWNSIAAGLGGVVDRTEEFEEQRLKIGQAQEKYSLISSNLERYVNNVGGDPRLGAVETEVIEEFGKVVADRANKETDLGGLKARIEKLLTQKKEQRAAASSG